MLDKKIIDVCCGGRMFWYDKKNPHVHFMDKRTLPKWSIKSRHSFSVDPDEVWDYTNINHSDKTFKIVVMDPPHLQSLWDNSRMAMKYWKVSKEWKQEMAKAFEESMRILDDYGLLVFKRNEHEIPLGEVTKLFPVKPTLGQRTGKNNKTIRLIYIKYPQETSCNP